ncbi:hypothetical protein [Paenibacillus sp. NAIST15-1]|uniref:hypothetical protein n=1 Tax=Paenibacillus sp. NAIST15-1 TaxID=1605994 RepID=UPI00086D047E|nr:hypothetical protein [Paenibacillus sp. NAIST15-1]GAV11282.1 hypothetical protein PBN151_1209 [Paenibacillus sp. NAIST15-1]
MAKYELNDDIINNILVFLDRVPFQGLKENQAINDIIHTLNSPIQEAPTIENKEIN